MLSVKSAVALLKVSVKIAERTVRLSRLAVFQQVRTGDPELVVLRNVGP